MIAGVNEKLEKTRNKIKIAVDLLWARYGVVAGGVSVTLNLLDGFMELHSDFEMWLIVAQDNKNIFNKYRKDSRFHHYICKLESANRKQSVIYQNLLLCKILKQIDADICFEPNNFMPIIFKGNKKYVTLVHDMQAFHYPEYFSLLKNIWLRINWKNTIRHSSRVVTISQYVKKDILWHYSVSEKKINVIYNPVEIEEKDVVQFDVISRRYGIKPDEYYYTVSSLAPHKNLGTLITMMAKYKNKLNGKKLVISGVGEGKDRRKIEDLLDKRKINKDVILTGFVSNAVRNTLYKNCAAFLFPSIFEGFGMPAVEAISLGTPVITTRETSLPEVTQNEAFYVDNPFDSREWAEKISDIQPKKYYMNFEIYKKEYAAQKYMDVFREVVGE